MFIEQATDMNAIKLFAFVADTVSVFTPARLYSFLTEPTCIFKACQGQLYLLIPQFQQRRKKVL
jgi:hypothetical protein